MSKLLSTHDKLTYISYMNIVCVINRLTVKNCMGIDVGEYSATVRGKSSQAKLIIEGKYVKDISVFIYFFFALSINFNINLEKWT